jgi:hypothetical protein
MFDDRDSLHRPSSSLMRAQEGRRPAALLLAAVLTLLPLLLFGAAAGASSPPPAITFDAGQTLNTGENDFNFVTGDFDNNGATDIVAANYPTNDLTVLLNDGAGVFSYGTTAVAVNSQAMAAGDLDRDGDLDLAVADDDAAGGVRTYLGDGDGGFTFGTSMAVGEFPRGLALGDIDRDGDLDLATSSQISASVSIRTNDGSGVFSESATLTAGDFPGRLAFGDIDKDGDLDLAIPNASSLNVSIRLNNGSGVFSNGTTVTAGVGARRLAFGDLDRDGDLDLAIANSVNNNFSIRLNNGTGLFSNGTTVPIAAAAGSTFEQVVATDFDRDGDLDLAAVTSAGDGAVSIYTGDGAGGFTAGPVFRREAASALMDCAVADFNRDGKPDVAALKKVVTPASAVWVFANTANVSNAAKYRPARDNAVGDWPTFVAPGYFDGDGDLDMVVSNGAADTLSVRLGDGSGGFSNGTTATTGDSPSELAVADFDRDGALDVAALNGVSSNVSIRLGNGAGAFSYGTTLAASGMPESIATADFDRNGTADLVVANTSSDTVGIRHGNGAGGFAAATTISIGASTRPESLVTGDFDLDGNPDLAVENQQPGTISILLGDGAGDFSFGTTRTTSNGNTGKMVACDLDRDGDLDLAFRSGGFISTAMNDGNAVFSLGPEVYIDASYAFQSLVAGDFDRNGIPDLAVARETVGAGDVLVLLRDGFGNFLSPVTVPSGDNTRFAAAGDFDSNGETDLAVANFGSDKVSIFLADTAPPATILTLDPGSPDGSADWYTSPPQIGLTPDETANICYQWDSTEGTWQGYSTTFTAQEGSHTLYYYAADEASNVETVQGRSIKTDSIAPSGTLVLASGAAYTTTTAVSAVSSVTDTGSGMGEMAFSADSTSAFDPWRPYAASAMATLTAGDGARVIYGRYRDVAGNVIETSDTIVLDSTAPTGTMTIKGGAASTNNLSVTIDCTVTDSLSGLGTMRWSNNGGTTWSSWVSYEPTCAATLALGVYPAYDGTRTITMQYSDGAANVLQLADDIRFVRPKATVGTPVLSPTVPRKYVFFTTWGIINQKVTGSTRLYLYRRVAGRWVQYPGRGRYLNAKNYSYGSRTKYLLRLKVPYSGSWYLRPYYAGGPVAAANWGKIKFFTVR